MKITKIETVRLTSRPTLIWVRVHTDQGLIGLGESWFGCAAVDADIHERIAPTLIHDGSPVHGRQVRDRLLHRQEWRGIGLRGRCIDHHPLAVDLLLLAYPALRGGVHQSVCGESGQSERGRSGVRSI